MLTGVNIPPTWLSEAASVLNCRTGSILFMYLGLPIGGDGRKLSFWKLLVDRNRARLSVSNNKFLSFGGRLEGGSDACTWWRMICHMRDGVGSGVGNWFDDNTRRVVGNGRNTFFWIDNWLGGAPLKLQFSRLYELSVLKECSMEDMARLGGEEGGKYPGLLEVVARSYTWLLDSWDISISNFC
ncbi:hypothetical protein MTR_1g044185 [Medicago truncatula]|uniref:Uncharacterized protein n=1 Tax=Medicago truncatula TaxID=3880 RepID=A0A072VH48_MEDTR|nr:hypothetical protein MTR_1g044185 [Medicago truncatula]